MIYDVFTFNGEYDLLDIHLNVLKDYVGKFVIVEFDKTFSGKDKPLYFKGVQDKYADFPIEYHTFSESFWEKYRGLAESSPNTIGADHWKREFMQKECLKDALESCKDDDLIFVGDTDEVWEPVLAEAAKDFTVVNKIKLRVYSYFLNNSSSEEFWGPIVGKWGFMKKQCMNHLRSHPNYKTPNEWGWHFTSQGGLDEVRRKLSDSYTEDSYWNPQVQTHLEQNMAQNKDFLGRDFTYIIDESEWPQYLKDNREKYKHLCYNE